jgi:malonyl-CoA/methylmalonyl-CoA synthetase
LRSLLAGVGEQRPQGSVERVVAEQMGIWAKVKEAGVSPLWDAIFAPLAARETPVLHLPEGGGMTGASFHALALGLAGRLVAEGVVPGDRVAAQVAKSPQALALYAACVAAGAVFLPMNTAYTPSEVEHFLTDAAPRLLVHDPAAGLGGLAARLGVRALTLDAAGRGTLEPAAPVLPVARGEADLAALLYTSGTTGKPKGAMLTQGNLLSNAQALAGLWRFTAEDVLLHALPVFHTHGLFVAVNTVLLAGGSMLWLTAFAADEVLRLMPRATVMMGVPTFYTRLLDHPGLTAGAVAGMRLFTCGSAPLLAETHIAWTARTGKPILERYGMTETNMTASNPYDDRRPGTVGLPLPGVEVRLNAGGEVEVRGPNVFAGYWNLPEKTAAEFTADGFFRTGDIGAFDDGYLKIIGRAKDLVITGGLNVYPVEVEEALDAMPGVLESAVVGLPHPDFGEAVFAVLVARPGVVLDPAAVLAAVAPRLARFKQPKAAVVVDALPRNAMGKVQKAALRQVYRNRFDQG